VREKRENRIERSRPEERIWPEEDRLLTTRLSQMSLTQFESKYISSIHLLLHERAQALARVLPLRTPQAPYCRVSGRGANCGSRDVHLESI